MQQAGLRPIINTNRTPSLPGYGKVPLHARVFECIGTGEASPRVARYLCSVEIGGFGLVLYASTIVQGAQEMQALHAALESVEDVAQQLEGVFAEAFEGRALPDKLHAATGGAAIVFDLMEYGEPMPAPTLEPGVQHVTETHG